MEDQQAQINQGMLANMQAIAQQLQALQAQINAMAPVQGGNVGEGAPAPIPAVFADTPGRRKADDIIDYSTTTGMKIYKEASTELKVKFDVESSQVVLFCEALKSRAQDSGWALGEGDIINIPDEKGDKHNLLMEFGCLTTQEIKTHVTSYLVANGRKAQNSTQMLNCLKASITDAGWLKIMSEADKYTVDEKESGPLLFKLLMQTAVVDTVATAEFYRANLSSLDTYVATVDSNIEIFNQYVKTQLAGLKARGETTNDLLTNLFKAYLNVSDEAFVRYIELKKIAFEDGQEIKPDALMSLALNKYATLKQQGKWKALTPTDEKLVALSAQFKEIKDKNLKLTSALKKALKSRGKDKGSKAERDKKKKQNQEWKKIPPKDGEAKQKSVGKNTYHWCDKHKAWTVHKPEDCRLSESQEETKHKKAPKEKGKAKKSRRDQFAEALATIYEDLSEEEEGD
jgi:hypothetical protein